MMNPAGCGLALCGGEFYCGGD